jgi:UDP-3-O-[3-hydroxymyristoyl] glucosamine N-acyltransferase
MCSSGILLLATYLETQTNMKYTEKERLEFAKSHQWAEGEVIIGETAYVHPSTIIGEAGFGYVREDDGTLMSMPHAGGVIIENGVAIAAYVAIDRAVVGNTVIGQGSKLDHHVHIGHGAKIGKDCLLVAGTVVGGSAEIGDRCYLGMGCLIKNKVKIGNDVTVGMGAVVTKDIPNGETWVGNPARLLRKNE